MLDLAKILAAVSVVSEVSRATETGETQAGRGVSPVSVVSVRNRQTAHESSDAETYQDSGQESASRTTSFNRDNRDNRDTSNGAGFGVSVRISATETTETGGTGCDSRGRPLMPLVRCGDCQNFQPNRDNPAVGCGTCALGEPDLGGWPHFPGARRCCVKHSRVEMRATHATNTTEVTP